MLLQKFSHKGKYTAQEVDIDDAIGMLISQKALINEAVNFIALLDKNLEVENVKLSVSDLQSNSLLWDIAVEIYGKYQTDIEDTVIPSLEYLFGTDIPESAKGLVTIATLVVVYFVARYAYDLVKGRKKDKGESIHIDGSFNTVIGDLSGVVNIGTEELQTTLEQAIPDKKKRKLIKPVTNFFKIARRDPKSKIEIENAQDVTPETIKEYPNDADLSLIDESMNIDLADAQIDIRAVDRDRGKSGWSAVILHDKRFPVRLPMDLFPKLSPEELAKHQYIKADALVECKKSATGENVPKKIHLLKFEPVEEE